MANHSFNFPLLASDQADVIRIYLDLMIERDRVGHGTEVAANHTIGQHINTGGTLFPSELPDLD